ncbi:amidohydrolase family protein [Rhizobium leguminosarum]|uniref:amidohydrolase family protein n=1 Tax=Rhizobium leguminosarum TaxID=384 RepID=UPI000416C8EE|nr:amidohydrolase family protein [Rhizobium leguminosarum]MBY5325150.1 amidohydrolase family protein [Rhizobium leguminosarum]MBY5386074.1 amidohydrolase family protein [Rhizobium leguminosarum]NEH46469.1 amidohydrolase family protein [Rhizobium leguminosarum]NEH74583.1 amidohydrolase family protein [Rhizobium leguminosarum]NEI01384.1 amidohydrolase family protein [Rhizobium leguminosarum]
MDTITLTAATLAGNERGRATDIFIEADRIADLQPTGARPPQGTVIDASRLLVTPGLIDGHHHSHENYLKGRFEGQPLELVMNFVRPLKPVPLTARQVYVRTLISAIQAIRSGATTLVDDMNVGPMLDRSHVDAAFQAYEDCGIRALLGFTLFDRPFFRAMPFVEEEFPAELLAQLDAVRPTPAGDVLALAREMARSRHPSEHRVGYIVAPSAPQRCTDDFLKATRSLADEFDLPVMIHVQETRLQAVTGQIMYGSSMFAHLDRLGFLKEKTALIHAVWLTPADISIIAASGASVQHNPTVNMKLGSGLMPMREMLDAGINVSLGTDGCGLVETADMLRAVSNTAYVQKLRGNDPDRWITAPEAFHAATKGGARALGLEKQIGEIKVGMKADLSGYSLDQIAFVPLNDPIRQLVYAETGSGLRLSIVDGTVIFRDGKLTLIDEAAILREAQEIHAELEPIITAVEESVAPLLAPYRRIHARCLCHPIASDTYPARFECAL